MWTCRNCNAEHSFTALSAEADGEGLYFICPDCDYRNALIKMGAADGPIELVQPEIDWPPDKH